MSDSLLSASVIPNRKTPRGVDTFTYQIPLELQSAVKIGTTVTIPFRSQRINGVVHSIEKQAVRKNLKPIEAVSDVQLWLRPDRMQLLEWFARTYWVSLATALHTMQFDFIKKTTFELPLIPETPERLHIQAVLYNDTETHDEFLIRAITQAVGPCIIIEPEERHARALMELCAKKQIPIHSVFGTTGKKAWTAAQETILAGKPSVVIGSRKLLFAAFSPNTTLIIDHEHEKAHKQYDLNPRYRATTVADFLATHVRSGLSQVFLLSQTPSLSTWLHVQEKKYSLLDIRKNLQTPLDLIDMNHFASQNRWLSDEAIARVRVAPKSFLFLNRIGLSAYVICNDCGKTSVERSVLCSHCSGASLRTIKKGVTQLEAEIQEVFNDKKIVRIDSSTDIDSAEMRSQIAAADIILGTEKVLRACSLSDFSEIIVLSIDHLLTYPHYQSQERVFQILTELQISEAPLLIQTHALHHPLWDFVQKNDVVGFLNAELTLRRMLRRPPAYPYWVAKDPNTQHIERLTNIQAVAALPPSQIIDWVED